MSRRPALALGVLLALAPAAPAAAAGLPSWAKELARAEPPPAAPGTRAVVLLDQTSIRHERDARLRIVRRRAVRLLDSRGTDAAVMVVQVDPGGAIESFEAWTFGGGEVRGTAHTGQRVESMLSSEGPTDVRRAALGAPGARAGDLVVFEAAWSEPAPLPAHLWLPQDANLPVVRAEFTLELPKGWSAEVTGCGVEAVDAEPAPERVRLSLANLPGLPDEPARPDDSRLMPRVQVRVADAAGDSPFASWEALAGWYERLAGDAAGPAACPPELRRAAAAETLAFVKALARRVQSDVRYVAVELGMRRWQPDSAALTWRLRYGDCKDKSALLASALEANGVPARLVLACARERWDVHPEAPSPFEFNHCIVAFRWPGPDPPAGATVKTKGGREWTLFDPTDESVPLGSVSAALGGTWGVIADDEDGGLVRLPEATPSTLRHVVSARLAETGELRGRLAVFADGPLSESFRGRFGRPGADVFRARAREYLAGRWPRAALDSCGILVDSPDGQRFGLSLDFRLGGAARADGPRWMYAPRFEAGTVGAPPGDSVRTLPIVLGARGRFEEVWQVELPPGFDAETRSPIEWHGPAGDYFTRFEAGPSLLTVRRRLDLRLEQLPASEFAQARALLKALYAGERASVLLTRRRD